MSAWTVQVRSVAARHVFGLVCGALCGLAWLLLALWGLSPYARYLRHDILVEVQLPTDPRPVIFFVAAWLLMTVAMMLPTTWPLVTLLRALVRQRPDRHRLIGFLSAGYLSVWLAFGLAVYLADWGLHAAVAGIGWVNESA